MRGSVFIRQAVAAVLLIVTLTATQTSAGSQATAQESEETRALAAALFAMDPEQLTVGPPGGSPPVVRVERNGAFVGYLASTFSVVGSVGYSGKPIDVMIAVDTNATIVGARLLDQSEPILTIGISDDDIAHYVGGFAKVALGRDKSPKSRPDGPDAITGATISSGVIRDSIIRTGRVVALAYGLLDSRTSRKIDRTGFVKSDWAQLISDDALAHRSITMGDVREALNSLEYKANVGGPEKSFIELYYGLLTPAQIGQNLLGKQLFSALVSQSNTGDHSILVAANGLYSFKGTRWRKSGVFERIELHQDNRSIRLTRDGYQNVQRLAVAGAPTFRETAVFTIPEATGFDPTRQWRLSLLVSDETDGGARLTTAFPLYYTLPDRFTVAKGRPTVAVDMTLWQRNWIARIPAIATVCVMLLILAAILVFQDALARRIRLYTTVRFAYLTTTLVVLGWGLGAQLSVVHVLAFAQSIRTGFQWETFLLDPLIFILWGTVAVSLLFWGRGVFCGWLCPFGALQELLNMAAKRLGIRQIDVPFTLHERLWPIKYILFLGLFALSLHSIADAFYFAEVEPFKTTMTMKFARAWPFIAYVVVLLAAGLFVERAYCRYLCPLGAALAIPARLRMFEWLKRRPQCGRECRICAVRCTVQAIHPDGHINPNECIHCLRCQTNYFDATTCPPLKARKRRRAPQAEVPTPATPSQGSAS